MSEIRQPCIVESHEAHDRPRVFVLREPGCLWLFDLCNPHVWPGSHWGIPEKVARSGNGLVIHQEMTGEARSVVATGKTMHELRAALVAELSCALLPERTTAQISVVVRRPPVRRTRS